MINCSALITDSENVARILHRNWVVDGILQHYAFALKRKESYISVNRPAVSSYDADIASFIENHPDFYTNEDKTEYSRALVNVGEIRKIGVVINGINLNIDVEVEPRVVHTNSHAGIFTRYEGENIKTDDTLYIKPLDEEVSSDEILLEVRSRLLELAQLERCKLNV